MHLSWVAFLCSLLSLGWSSTRLPGGRLCGYARWRREGHPAVGGLTSAEPWHGCPGAVENAPSPQGEGVCVFSWARTCADMLGSLGEISSWLTAGDNAWWWASPHGVCAAWRCWHCHLRTGDSITAVIHLVKAHVSLNILCYIWKKCPKNTYVFISKVHDEHIFSPAIFSWVRSLEKQRQRSVSFQISWISGESDFHARLSVESHGDSDPWTMSYVMSDLLWSKGLAQGGNCALVASFPII